MSFNDKSFVDGDVIGFDDFKEMLLNQKLGGLS